MRIPILILAMALAASPVHACVCLKYAAEEFYSDADAVFVGQVEHFRYTPFSSTYSVKVSRAWKGIEDEFVAVRSHPHSPITVCSYPLPVGSKVLMYARYEDGGLYAATGCGGSRALDRAEHHVTFLEALPSYSLEGQANVRQPNFFWSDMLCRFLYVPLGCLLFYSRGVGRSNRSATRRHVLSLVWFSGVGVFALLLGNENLFNAVGAGNVAALTFLLGNIWTTYVAMTGAFLLVLCFGIAVPLRTCWRALIAAVTRPKPPS